jgi:hypothetical protein
MSQSIMFLRIVSSSCLLFLFATCESGDSKAIKGLTTDTVVKSSDATRLVERAISCDQTNIKDSTYSFKNDEFVSYVLQNELTTKFLDSIYSGVKKQTTLSENNYTPNTFDTTVTYKADCDSVVYISSKANSFPLYLSIQSGRIILDAGFLKAGLSKNEFIEKFHLDRNVPDVIKITETEGNNEFIFVFAGNSLIRIVYNNLYAE